MKDIVLASGNPGKVREIHELLAQLDMHVVPQGDYAVADAEETGLSFVENAILKARNAAAHTGLPAIADDSGLEVDALDGAPGLYSARYSTLPNATDKDRRAYLLKNLNGIPRPWRARFRATVAVAGPGRSVELAEGICPGEIIPEERGSGGFGYDPIFLVDGTNQTMAELDMEEKNRLSHRGQALLNMLPILSELFEN